MQILKSVYKSNLSIWFFFVVGAILVLFSGLRPIGLDPDSANYVVVLKSQLSEFSFLEKEPLYLLIIWLSKVFSNNDVGFFFLTFSLIGVSVKLYAILKVSKYQLLSLYLYICLYFVLHEMTQIRAGVASGLFLLSTKDYYDKKYGAFLIKILIASMFHYSSLCALVLLVLRRHTFSYFWVLLPFMGMAIYYLLSLNYIVFFSSYILPDVLYRKVAIYSSADVSNNLSEINIFNIYYSSLLVLYCFYSLNFKCIRDSYDLYLLKIFGVALFSFYSLASIPVLAFRISEFLNIVLIIFLANSLSVFKERVLVLMVLLPWAFLYFVSQSLMKGLGL